MKALKYGCFGCLGVVGILVVACLAVGGLAWQKSRSLHAEDQVLTRELPAPQEEPGNPPVSPEELAADVSGAGGEPPEPGAGHLVLDLSDASFEIERGEPGTPLKVDGRFDRNNYNLQQTFETGDAGEWTCKVTFERKPGVGGLITRIGEVISGTSPKVVIRVPPDRPLALKADVEHGGFRGRLGGLWLTAIDVDFAMGGAVLVFDEPLREPVRELRVTGKMGGAALVRIGNASPRRLQLDYSMGGFDLDLSGHWLRDADISLQTGMGGGTVRLPDGVFLEGLPAGAGDDRAAPDEGAPHLRFSLSGEAEKLRFQ